MIHTVLVLILCFVKCIFTVPTAFAPETPTFPESFTVNIEGYFRSEKDLVEMDAALYYDRINNRAAIDILYQSDRAIGIYNFDEDNVLMIQGTTCSAESIGLDNSFFPFTVDKKTGKKTLGTAEEMFYFTNSTYYSEDINTDVPLSVYNGTVDVPKYNRKGCNIVHRFSKPEVKMAQCDSFRNCKSTLYSLTVQCGKDRNLVYHRYQFYSFQNTMKNEEIFQIPVGIYCPSKGGLDFPAMPKFFCFNYDSNLEWMDNDIVQDTQDFYRSLCFDAELQLLRVDNYNAQDLASTQIYDFQNAVGIAITPTLGQCEVGPTTSQLTMSEATFLPDEIFPRNLSKDVQKPLYVGLRSYHGLSYYTWSSYSEKDGMKSVKDFYFAQKAKNSSDRPVFHLSHIEEFFYERDNEKKKMTLSEVSFIPIRQIRTTPRDWSVFNVSVCFPASARKVFEIRLKIECLLRNSTTKCPTPKNLDKKSKLYDEIVQKLYALLVQSGKISVLRLSGLQISSMSDGDLVFRGTILEHPGILSDTIMSDRNESKMSTAFENIGRDVGSGNISFNVEINEQVIFLKATSFVEPRPAENDKSLEDLGGYTPGAMAGVGIIMALIGALIGGIALFVYLKSKSGIEREKLTNS